MEIRSNGSGRIQVYLSLIERTLSSAGEFHPRALPEPYVTVSRHTAPTVQPTAGNQIPKTQTVQVPGVPYDLTSGSL
jgi:hypothetical protein